MHRWVIELYKNTIDAKIKPDKLFVIRKNRYIIPGQFLKEGGKRKWYCFSHQTEKFVLTYYNYK